MRFLLKIIFVIFLSGCHTIQFSSNDQDEYQVSKVSNACAAGRMDSLVTELRAEASKLCAMRKEKVVDLEVTGQDGIPFVRCGQASLKFKCESRNVQK